MTATGIFRLSERVFRPWKNGGGQTAEIIVSPPGAGFEDFDWRISTAVVAASGPFSTFPGVDRVLTVVEGGGMTLTVGEQEHHLDADSEPYPFSGDIAAAARLDGEALLDFNVMVRRPLQAKVVRGPFDPGSTATERRARLVLLLEDRAGLVRLDLVDLDALAPALASSLAGAQVLDVVVSG